MEGEVDDGPISLLSRLHDVVAMHPVEVELKGDVERSGRAYDDPDQRGCYK